MLTNILEEIHVLGSRTYRETRRRSSRAIRGMAKINKVWVRPMLDTDLSWGSAGITCEILFHGLQPPDDRKGTLKQLVRWYYAGQKIGKINRYDWAEHLAAQYTHKGKPISPKVLRSTCS